MERIRELSLTDNGFVFDPATGESFSVNPSGFLILSQFQAGQDQQQVVAHLAEANALSLDQALRDVADFLEQLAAVGLGRSREGVQA